MSINNKDTVKSEFFSMIMCILRIDNAQYYLLCNMDSKKKIPICHVVLFLAQR